MGLWQIGILHEGSKKLELATIVCDDQQKCSGGMKYFTCDKEITSNHLHPSSKDGFKQMDFENSMRDLKKETVGLDKCKQTTDA